MNIKNAVSKNENNTLIDVEIEHPMYGWIAYTFKSDEQDESFDSEIRAWLKTANIEKFIEPIKTEEEFLAQKIAEAKAYLASTDFKDLPRYKPKDGEDMETIYAKRDEAREFIRTNDVPNS